MLQHDDRHGVRREGIEDLVRQWVFGLPMTNVVGVQTRIDDIKDVGIFPTF